MTNFPYNRDIPDGPHNPSVDQPNMKINTNSTDSLIDVDHVSFGQTDGGYHKDIHCLLQSPAPASTLGLGQIYYGNSTIPAASKNFFMDNGVRPFQMTGGLQNQNGYGWSGGMLFQWGIASTANDLLPVQLPIGFPNNFYSVTASPSYSGARPSPANIVQINIDSSSFTTGATSEFNWDGTAGNFAQIPNFFWFAIGN